MFNHTWLFSLFYFRKHFVHENPLTPVEHLQKFCQLEIFGCWCKRWDGKKRTSENRISNTFYMNCYIVLSCPFSHPLNS